jgi:hypothetical protein
MQLSNNRVYADATSTLNMLQPITSLKHLDLSYNQIVGVIPVRCVLKCLGLLKELFVPWCAFCFHPACRLCSFMTDCSLCLSYTYSRLPMDVQVICVLIPLFFDLQANFGVTWRAQLESISLQSNSITDMALVCDYMGTALIFRFNCLLEFDFDFAADA